MSSLKCLSILIPAYNEEENIKRVIRQALEDAKRLTNDFEIVIVDDGSSDNTGKIADLIARKDKYVRIIHHKTNQGLGQALQTGVKECKNDFIIYIEGDGQSLLKDQGKLFEKINESEIVLGYRHSRKDYTLFRKILSYGYLLLLRILFNLTFRDVNWSAAFQRKIFDSIEVKSSTPFFLAETVIKSLRYGFRVCEAPTLYHPRIAGHTSLGNVRTAYHMFLEMIKFRFGLD